MKPHYLLFIFTVLLLSCGGTAVPAATPQPTAPLVEATAVPQNTIAAPTAPAALPTATAVAAVEAAPTAVEEPTAAAATVETPLVVSGRTDDGAYFRGSPDAPITLIDYSDFL